MSHVQALVRGLAIAGIALGALTSPASARTFHPYKSFTFPLTVSAGAAACVPNATGQATITSAGDVEDLKVQVAGLPANSGFDFFLIQVPNGPFGLSWYQGDISTDKYGNGHGEFLGRFSIETFIVAPNTAPAPVIFTNTPFPDGNANPASPPIHTYHLGIWFDSTKAAKKAGCATTETPFNGKHTAGIQVLNTATFPDLAGPLLSFK